MGVEVKHGFLCREGFEAHVAFPASVPDDSSGGRLGGLPLRLGRSERLAYPSAMIAWEA